MTSITNIDKVSVKQIIRECEEALQTVADKYDLVLTRKNCSYLPTEMPVPFKLNTKSFSNDGEELDQDEAEFKRSCRFFGFEKEDFGKTFSTRNSTFKICGLKRNNKKYPIIAEDLTTKKKYKFTCFDVKQYLSYQKTMNATNNLSKL